MNNDNKKLNDVISAAINRVCQIISKRDSEGNIGRGCNKTVRYYCCPKDRNLRIAFSFDNDKLLSGRKLEIIVELQGELLKTVVEDKRLIDFPKQDEWVVEYPDLEKQLKYLMKKNPKVKQENLWAHFATQCFVLTEFAIQRCVKTEEEIEDLGQTIFKICKTPMLEIYKKVEQELGLSPDKDQ